jgi:hypothetical protein
VARHRRDFGPEPATDFWHYLPVLTRNPEAVDHTIPVRQTHFPEEAREGLEARHSADRTMAHREFLTVCGMATGVEPVRWVAVGTWLAAHVARVEAVAMDGKTVRGAKGDGGGLQLLRAMAHDQ